TAVEEGSATVTATSTTDGDITGSATITVTVPSVTSVTLNPNSATIAVKDAPLELGVVVMVGTDVVTDRTVSWSSSDENIATVVDGDVTAVAPGTVLIMATSEGVSGSAAITVLPMPVTDVEISSSVTSINVGQTTTFSVEVLNDTDVLEDRFVEWVSTNTSVARVDSTGTVIGRAAGQTTIRAISEGIESNDIELTVTAVSTSDEVTAVDVTPITLTLEVDATHIMQAEARDGTTALPALDVDSWESSDPTVAQIDAAGEVTAVAPGITLITATIDGVEGYGFIQVTPKSVTDVSISQGNATIREGEHIDLTVTVNSGELTDRIVVWTTSNDAVATVDSNGRVYGLAEGAVTITASVDGKEATSEITVDPRAVDHIDLTPKSADLVVDDELLIDAVVRAADGRALLGESVIWSVAQGSTAVSVSTTGLVTALEEGTADVVATSSTDGTVTATAAITVSLRPVSSVTVSPSSASLALDDAPLQLDVVVLTGTTPVTDRTVSWTSSDEAVATVIDGLVSPVATGTVLITATSEGVHGSAAITVTPVDDTADVASITIVLVDGDTAEVGFGLTLEADVEDTNSNPMSGHPVTWSSSDETVATVDADTGVVMALTPGTTTITATSGEDTNISDDEVITVTFAFTHIAAGPTQTCGVSTMGNLYCWGANESAQFGDGTLAGSAKPRLVAADAEFTDLSIGLSHGCGLMDDKAYCWGANDRGQLGDSTSLDSRAPVEVSGDHVFVELEAGDEHTCARTAAGAVYCWGANDRGQLGDTSILDSNVPVAVAGTFVAIGAGEEHTCGLADDKKVYCWGDNADSQLGQEATTAMSSIPLAILGDGDFIALAIGGRHGCAIEEKTSDAETYCWGANANGQLGDNSTDSSTDPVSLNGSPYLAFLAAGSAHGCGLTDLGAALCWGANGAGQVGNDSTDDALSAVAVNGTHVFTAITAGGASTCGIDSDGIVYCWGDNSSGQLGDDSGMNQSSPVEISLPE
ncbi:MAG: Ig-like domain-containing protein, partial [Bradymonadaceae bacterium]